MVRFRTCTTATLATVLLLAVTSQMACSSGPTQLVKASEFDGGGDAAVGDGGGPDASTKADSGTEDVVNQLDTGPSDSGSLFDECANEKVAAHLIPLDIFVMLDQSGSMTGPRWKAVTTALESFASNPKNAELGMGLQFFPLPGSEVCSYEAYANPAVPLAPLSTNAPLIADEIEKHTPAGETPTLPALQGVLSQAKDWLTANPDHTVAVIIATDGQPNVCGSTVDNVAQAAKLAFEQPPSVSTFVIGVGSELSSLDKVAAAGGTQNAYIVDDAQQDTAEQFSKALQAIRGKALSCEFAIPSPEAGTLDYTKVNVVHRQADGKQTIYGKVDGPDGCNDGDGWYYDDESSPSKVVLCQATCDAVQGDPDGEIEVIFGCETHLR